jgi:hypothetical protein
MSKVVVYSSETEWLTLRVYEDPILTIKGLAKVSNIDHYNISGT